MRRPLLAALLALACATTTGCYNVTVQSDALNPVLINKPKPGGHYFQREERAHFIFWGLWALNPNVVQDALRSYQIGDLRAVNVQVEFDVLGYLAAGLTYGFYANRLVRIEGATD